jgi:carboxymethylenebutenolidase
MREKMIELATADGDMKTFVVHPERGGPHPLVIFLMDAAGIREELRDMARRIASTGYYVIQPNLYHRQGVFELPADATHDDMRPLMMATTMEMVMSDCDTALAYAEKDPAAETSKIAIVGYCMTGQHAINYAARHPDRVVAAASFHGVRLVTDQPDSPHLMMQKAKARMYFGCAELDAWAPMEMVNALSETVDATGVNAEVEILKGLDHGFVFPGRAVYDKRGAEQHYERLGTLLRSKLPPPTGDRA